MFQFAHLHECVYFYVDVLEKLELLDDIFTICTFVTVWLETTASFRKENLSSEALVLSFCSFWGVAVEPCCVQIAYEHWHKYTDEQEPNYTFLFPKFLDGNCTIHDYYTISGRKFDGCQQLLLLCYIISRNDHFDDMGVNNLVFVPCLSGNFCVSGCGHVPTCCCCQFC